MSDKAFYSIVHEGRALTLPRVTTILNEVFANGDGTFTCAVVTKESRFA